jgi:hypothetical protein
VAPPLVLVVGALATGAVATGCEAFEASLGVTIVVIVPFLASIAESAAEGGLALSHWYGDPEGLFALAVLRRSDP